MSELPERSSRNATTKWAPLLIRSGYHRLPAVGLVVRGSGDRHAVELPAGVGGKGKGQYNERGCEKSEHGGAPLVVEGNAPPIGRSPGPPVTEKVASLPGDHHFPGHRLGPRVHAEEINTAWPLGAAVVEG